MKKTNKNKKIFDVRLLAIALVVAAHAQAMEALSDDDLSVETGQAGLTATLSAPSITATGVTTCFDTSTSNCNTLTGADAAKLSLNGISISKIGMNGAAAAGNWTSTVTIDAYNNPIDNHVGVAVVADWDRGRFAIDSLQLGSSAATLGNVVVDAGGHFELIGDNGFFNSNSLATAAKLQLRLDNATVFMRSQKVNGTPELEMNNLNFLWDMPVGVVGINSKGLLIRGNVNFNLTFDLLFDPTGATPLAIGTAAQDRPILHYGWTGGLLDAQVSVGGGGAWLESSVSGAAPNQKYLRPNDPANPGDIGVVVSQGLNFGLHWNYKNDFRWIVGEVDSDGAGPLKPATLEFGDWQSLPNTVQTANQPALTTYAFDFPYITLDMIKAGRGPGGLCWGANWEGPASSCEAAVHGGQFLKVDPENDSLAVLVRDGFLRAYSSNVKILDPTLPDRTLGWGLIYTLGNIDANIFLRPDERSGMAGMKMDVVMMSQTFDVFDKDADGNQWEQGPNWGYGSHFMIADTAATPCASTNKCLGIGILDASFLLAADNLYFNYLPQVTRPGGAGAGDVRSAGISIGDSNLLTASALTTSPVRIAFNGRFGGGDVPNMANRVNISDVRMNLEFDRFHMMLTPPVAGQMYLGYEATMRFADLDIANFSETNDASSLDPGSNITMSEPGRLESSVRFADIKGWLAARDGRIKIYADSVTPLGSAGDLPAQLVIENTLLIGRSVTNVAGAELAINRIELGTMPSPGVIDYNKVGTIVIPSGQWYGRVALQPQF